jgi:peptide/nickel transport system permease protein
MSPFLRYVLQRIGQYLLVIWVGVTIAFVIPRFMPVDAVEIMISRAEAAGQLIDPEAVEQMKETLRELYGLKGTLLQQYLGFWSRLVHGSFGPSLSSFPTPVIDLVRQALPWTLGLLTISTIVSWVIGTVTGALAGFFNRTRWARTLEVLSMVLFPMPYYIMALLIVALFTLVLPWFPLVGGAAIGVKPSFSLGFVLTIVHHATLPALSLVLVGIGASFLTMRQLITRINGEDYVTYARATGQSSPRIMFVHVMPNAMLPQVTRLALSLGQVFSGALVAEYVFSYPGLGQLLYTAVLRADVNLMVGIVSMSVVAIATAVLVVDLTYPLFDPRVRYR